MFSREQELTVKLKALEEVVQNTLKGLDTGLEENEIKLLSTDLGDTEHLDPAEMEQIQALQQKYPYLANILKMKIKAENEIKVLSESKPKLPPRKKQRISPETSSQLRANLGENQEMRGEVFNIGPEVIEVMLLNLEVISLLPWITVNKTITGMVIALIENIIKKDIQELYRALEQRMSFEYALLSEFICQAGKKGYLPLLLQTGSNYDSPSESQPQKVELKTQIKRVLDCNLRFQVESTNPEIRSNLHHADLQGIPLFGEYIKANFKLANLQNTRLNGNFSDADFSFANLTAANLVEYALKFVVSQNRRDLTRTSNFSNTNFKGANLTCVKNFHEANFSNANFAHAILTGVLKGGFCKEDDMVVAKLLEAASIIDLKFDGCPWDEISIPNKKALCAKVLHDYLAIMEKSNSLAEVCDLFSHLQNDQILMTDYQFHTHAMIQATTVINRLVKYNVSALNQDMIDKLESICQLSERSDKRISSFILFKAENASPLELRKTLNQLNKIRANEALMPRGMKRTANPY